MSSDAGAFARLTAALAQVPPAERPALIARALGNRVRRVGVDAAYAGGLYRWAPGRMKGRGVVLLFHEIHQDVGRELMVGAELGHLMNAVRFCREDRRDIVDLDEAARRLGDPAAPPFAVITFDDGYRDIRTRVLPALAAENVPFTVYVPTRAPTGELYGWWLGLRELFRRNDVVTVAAMDRTFTTGTSAGKVVALRAVNAWVGEDFGRAPALADTFAQYGVDLPRIVADRMMSESELREVAAHPLLTVGAHTESHAALALLPERDAEGEMIRNKRYLETLLQRPVDHIAYPYGSPGACGEREGRIAARAGFTTATTTCSGTLGAEEAGRPHLWPREDVGYPAQTPATVAAHCYGLARWLG